MHENCRPQFLSLGKNGEEPLIGKIHVFHMGTNLYPLHAKLLDAAYQFGASQIGVLHRQGAEPVKAVGILSDNLSQMIVEKARGIETVFRFCPVVEHDRHGREHLLCYTGLLHVFDAGGTAPEILFHFPKELAVIAHHASAAGLVML